MKSFAKIILSILSISLLYSFSYAGNRSDWGSTPLQVFETVVNEANSNGDYNIQETALDGITDLQGSYARQYKISNTLDYLRQNISPYLQWAAYIGLVASTLGLIVCGLLMVVGGIGKSTGFEKVKGKIFNALIGVFLLSGFYVIIDIMVGVINMFVGD